MDMSNWENQRKKIIQTAMLNEREGAEFYRIAAKQFQHKEIQDALLLLSLEEEKHLEYLKRELAQLQGQDSFLSSEIQVPSPGIFNEALLKEELLDLSVSVFGMAVNMERASVIFYQKALEETEHPEVVELLKKLIQWEKNHLSMFENQYYKLKEEWWTSQGYAPF